MDAYSRARYSGGKPSIDAGERSQTIMAGTASPERGARAAGSKPNLYEVIRDQLIGEIESGRYPAGSLLPSVRELTAQKAISTTTARKALAEVVSAGYARSEGTRGHVSVGPRTQDSLSASDEPREAPDSVSGTLVIRPAVVIPSGGNAGPETSRTTVDVRTEPASDAAALALSLEDSSTPVIVRRRLTLDEHGTPIELRTSHLVRAFAEGTSLAAQEQINGTWRDALLSAHGGPLAEASSHVTARHPVDAEAAMLGLRPTACVLVRTETTRKQDGSPVDYTVTVWPGESTRLELSDD
ncbi:GntR family transcriptional regulator [Actinomadura opuntiae]|uniref:GntR family transcriptional regulator n=1 Tax=Actinomadura sp. OS1-43 TaxID=604315 RepID=UPI00255A7F88|nr:GntR family transcriptional regulator [Actinomadura sp. OS1-43]